MKIRCVVLFIWVLCPFLTVYAQVGYPGKAPGKASVTRLNNNLYVIGNDILRMGLKAEKGIVKIQDFEDLTGADRFDTGNMPLFEFELKDGAAISSDNFTLIDSPVIGDAQLETGSTAAAGRFPGKKLSADLVCNEPQIKVHWEAVLRDGSNYVRNIFVFTYDGLPEADRIIMLKLPAGEGIRTEGTVDGSPLIRKNMFFSPEHPLCKTSTIDNFITSYLPGGISGVSVVWGVAPEGQLRRAFLYYTERERLHPYHQVLHYNSWYDISWDGKKFNESQCLDRIKMFGDSLIVKRQVKMKGFLFDDGWDDNRTLWRFHEGFPEGFSNLKKTAEKYNSEVGVWLSPFGGYGEAKEARIGYGNKQTPPFETNEQGFSLSGPVYYDRFREVTSDFIKKYDICMFKFDGVGRGSGAEMVYQKDVESFLGLLKDLHGLKPDLYFSLTTGTWPSVWWLNYGDNIWRGGDDTNMKGEGSNRQKWITYRDAETYKNIVKGGPLYPLNSLMLCGICIAPNGIPGQFEMDEKDIKDEIWSFFGTGTNLQELYINPHQLTPESWSCLSEAASWAIANESIMPDVHWVGGDPGKGEVYGFAAWSPRKAVFTIRNPSSVQQSFEVVARKIFEIPKNVEDEFWFFDAMKSRKDSGKEIYNKGRTFKLNMKPFEVLVLDAFPVHGEAE